MSKGKPWTYQTGAGAGADIRVGDRIELHPAHDLWMRGARYGTIEKIGRRWLHVSLDRVGLRKISPGSVTLLERGK